MVRMQEITTTEQYILLLEMLLFFVLLMVCNLSLEVADQKSPRNQGLLNISE